MCAKTISRCGKGRSVIESAAYRSASKLQDNRTGKTYDFTRKRGVVHTEILLPENAPARFADRKTLWNEVEFVEKRKDSRLAREIVLGLPRKLLLKTSTELVREFVSKNFIPLGMCADIAIHIGHNKAEHQMEGNSADINLHNPHCHILLTDRPVDQHGFCSKKNPKWNSKELLLEWRKEWANIQNKMFLRKGLKTHVSHLSYKERNIDMEPTMHLGSVFAEMERRNIRTKIGDRNRTIEVRNNERKMRQREQRRSYSRSR